MDFLTFFSEKEVFFGRERELKRFNTALSLKNYMGKHWGIIGPRRVGKTALVEHFFRSKQGLTFSLTGNKHDTVEDAVRIAFETLNNAFRECDFNQPKSLERLDWVEFFNLLLSSLQAFQKEQPDSPILIFFDELDWFPDNDSFIRGYSRLINQSIFPKHNLMTFVASSSNSWLKSRIFKDVDGLHRRIDVLKVQPFSFKEIVSFFKANGWNLTTPQIFDYYLLFGGYIKHYYRIAESFNLNLPLKDNFSLLNKEKDYIEQEISDMFRNLFKTDKHLIACQTVCELKHATAQMIALSQGKKSHATAQLVTLNELESAGILSFTKVGGKKYYYCPIALMFLHTFFKGDFKITNYENWRGAAFELTTLFHIKQIEAFFGETFFDVQLNKTFTENDLLNNGKNNIKSQIDLIARTSDIKSRKKRHRLFELKAKTLNNISQKDIIDFVNRLNRIKPLFNEVAPCIISFETNVQRNIFGLPDILLGSEE